MKDKTDYKVEFCISVWRYEFALTLFLFLCEFDVLDDEDDDARWLGLCLGPVLFMFVAYKD